jgi:cytidylate kinase
MSDARPSPDRTIIVAIDGPAASGKSSTAHWVAERLGFHHVDSGALYRAATAAALRQWPDASCWTEERVRDAAREIALRPGKHTFVPFLGGEELLEELRGALVTRHVSQVAQMPCIRSWVNDHVRAAAAGHSVVVDGRDIGTVVFPHADLKIFLIADPWERARRRLIQQLGRAPSDTEIAAETERLVFRDARDATQTVQAKDAVLIDTTLLTQEEQVARIVALVRVLRGDG